MKYGLSSVRDKVISVWLKKQATMIYEQQEVLTGKRLAVLFSIISELREFFTHLYIC